MTQSQQIFVDGSPTIGGPSKSYARRLKQCYQRIIILFDLFLTILSFSFLLIHYGLLFLAVTMVPYCVGYQCSLGTMVVAMCTAMLTYCDVLHSDTETSSFYPSCVSVSFHFLFFLVFLICSSSFLFSGLFFIFLLYACSWSICFVVVDTPPPASGGLCTAGLEPTTTPV